MTFRWQDRINKSDAWLLGFLKQYKVPFIIVSGAATSFYGCRDEGYFDDLDIDLSPSKSNSRRFAKAMDAMRLSSGVKLVSSFPEFLMAKPKVLFNLDKAQFNIDFVTSTSSLEFNERFAASTVATIDSMVIKISSSVDLIKQTELTVERLRTVLGHHLADVELVKSAITRGPIQLISFEVSDLIKQILGKFAVAGVPLLLKGSLVTLIHGFAKLRTSSKFELLLKPDIASAKNFLMALETIKLENITKVWNEISTDYLIAPNSRVKPFPEFADFEFLVADSDIEFDRQLQNSFHYQLLNGPLLMLVSLPDMLSSMEKQVSLLQHKIGYKSRDLKRLRELKIS